MGHRVHSDVFSDQPFGQAFSMGDATLEPMGQFCEYYFKCAAEFNVEALKFLTHRLEEDVQLSQDLAQCKSPMEAYNAQMAFCRRMADDYINETQKMVAMSMAFNGAGKADEGRTIN